jgi:peptidoglycan-N-acetylglucosamine deacetylase
VAHACITFDHLGSTEQMAALRDTVERHGVTATFFVTGAQAAADPAGTAALAAAGHEVGTHGWAHEDWASLPPEEERALLERTTTTVSDAIGRPPLGFRAPGGARSDATSRYLVDLGYRYDASLGDDGMRPSRLAPTLAQVPFVWPGVDGAWYLRDDPAEPDVVRDAWLGALDRAAASDGLFVSICHPEITGVDERRVAALAAVVAAAAADRRVKVVTASAIAARIPA